MVGWHSASVGVQADFFREIGYGVGGIVVNGRAVCVGQHPIFLYGYAVAYKDMVDAALGVSVGLVAVECAVGGIDEIGCSERVKKEIRAGEHSIHLVGLVDVEVAGKKCREIHSNLLHLFLHEQYAFYTGLFANMVKMQIEKLECFA